jgi:hypothetical protein
MPRYWEDFSDIADINAFQLSTLTARDQYRLDVYECGSNEGLPCLIMPPPGVPFLVLAKLAQALGRTHRVISWETRGSSHVHNDNGTCSFTLEDYALDIAEIAASKNIKKARVISWCESFNLLPYLMSNTALEIEQIANISPAVYDKRHRTAVSLANESFLASMTSGDPASAREYYENYRMLRELTSSSLSASEKTLARILALPLNDFEAAARFAAICRHFQDRADKRLGLRVANAVESLFLHCQDDKVLDYKGTLAFFNRLQRGKLILNRTGGHYYLFHQAEDITREINCFFR